MRWEYNSVNTPRGKYYFTMQYITPLSGNNVSYLGSQGPKPKSSIGNGLYNNAPVHMTGTRKLVHTGTGEILNVSFIRFNRIRVAWLDEACHPFACHRLYISEDISVIKERYKKRVPCLFQTG